MSLIWVFWQGCTNLPHVLLNLTIPDSTSIMFGDLKTAAGVKALDGFLADHSYVEG